MRWLNKLLIICILILVCFASSVVAQDAGVAPIYCSEQDECIADGNILECTGNFTCDWVTSTDYDSVYIHDAVVTVSGGTGGGGEDAGHGVLVLGLGGGFNYFSGYSAFEGKLKKVKIENTVIEGTGGIGGPGSYSVRGVPHYGPGGDGGEAGLRVYAEELLMVNVTITTTSGIGGDGGCNVPSYTGEVGGIGGDSVFHLNVSDKINLTNVTTTLTSSSGGTPCANVECATNDDDSDGDDADGSNGGQNIIFIDSPDTHITGVSITTIGGAGSGGEADTCTHCYYTNCAEDTDEAAIGGKGGVLDFDWYGNFIVTNFALTTTSGTPGVSKTSCSAEAVFEGEAEAYDVGPGQSGDYVDININASGLLMTGSTFTVTGSTASDADACAEVDSQFTTPCAHAEGQGGVGGDIIINITSNYGTITSTSFTFTDGAGGNDDAASQNCDDDYDVKAGNGGANYINIIDTNIDMSTLIFTSGAGHASSGSEGGSAGDNTLKLYNSNIFNNSIFKLLSGVPGTGGIDNNYGPGSGGDQYFYNYGTLNSYNTTYNLTGGNSASSTCDSIAGYGGDALFYNENYSYSYDNTAFKLKGGTGVCNEAGDAEIHSTTYMFLKDTDITETAGILAGNQGDCDNTINGTFSIEDVSFICVSSGGAGIIGSNMEQFDYRNNVLVRLGGTPGTINLTYNSTKQKFLTWNATFNNTNIHWNCAQAEWGNRSPASTGTITFNESCQDNVTFDNYYTEFQYLKARYNSSGVTKPLPYSYTDYYCILNVEYPDDLEGTLKANFTWYYNGTLNKTETEATPTSGVDYISTAYINGDNISLYDNWTCESKLYTDFTETNTNESLVVPAYHYNLKINVGNNSKVDYNSTGQFIGAQSFQLNYSGLNDYIRTCTTDTCLIPIKFYSDENATLTFDNISARYGLGGSEGKFNMTIEVFSEEPGIVKISEVNFLYPYGDNQNYTITANGQTSASSESHVISTVVSTFDEYLPTNILYFEVYPQSATAQNVQPYGQTASTPIWTVYNNNTEENIDVYMKLEYSWASMSLNCMTLEFINGTTPQNTNYINTSGIEYCSSIPVGGSCTLWGFHDFACTQAELSRAVYEPNFIFDSMCTDCVRTYDWDD